MHFTITLVALGALVLSGSMLSPASSRADESALICACEPKHRSYWRGGVRIVEGAGKCSRSETETCWNPQGVTGPQGPPGPPTGATSRRYAGCSETEVTGAIGALRRNQICEQEFGAGARMCTSEQILWSVLVEEEAGNCWAHPVYQPHGLKFDEDPGGFAVVVDASGVTSLDLIGQSRQGELTCNGWRTTVSSFTGLLLDTNDGSFRSASCDEEFAISCCVPLTP